MARPPANSNSGVRELTNENIFQLLSQGVLILMEDDLRKLQAEQAADVRGKMTRGRLKIAPQEEAKETTAPIRREGFLFGLKKRLHLGGKKALPSESPQAAPADAIFPRPAFPAAEVKTTPVIKKKELASGLRFGEKIIEPAEEGKIESLKMPQARPLEEIAQVIPPSISVPALPVAFKAEPYAIDDLKERIAQKNKLEQERSELDTKLLVFWPQRRPLELKVAVLQEERQALVKSLSPFIANEGQIKAQEKDIEEKEKKAQSVQEKHQIEEQRWALEKNRREAEKQKWAQEERIEAKNAEIKAAELALQAVLSQEAGLRERKEATVEGLEKIGLAQERLMLIEKVLGPDLQRRELGKEKLALGAVQQSLNKELFEISSKEKALEAQEVSLEASMEQAASLKERREIEQSRWQLEEQRKSAEQRRWEIEKKIEQGKEQASILQKNYEEAFKKQMALEIRADEIDILLRNPFAQAEKILAQRGQQKEQIEAVKKQEIETRSEQIQPLVPVLEVVEKPVQEKPVEKLGLGLPAGAEPQPSAAGGEVILSDEEAKTAAKIRQKALEREREEKLALIQQKAEIQRESLVVPKIKGPISKAEILLKLSRISPEEQVGRERFLSRLAGKTPIFSIKPQNNGKEIMFRPLVKKSSVLEKILARLLFLLVIFTVVVIIFVLLYFYVFLPKPKVYPLLPPVVPGVENEVATSSVIIPIELPTSTELGTSTGAGEVSVTTTPATSTQATSTPIIPAPATSTPATSSAAAVLVGETKILEFASIAEISGLLKNALQDNKGVGLNRLIFQTSGQALSLPDFLVVFQAAWPGNVSGLLKNESILIVSGEGLASRFGLIVPVNNSVALVQALKSWEPNMEKDWAGLWFTLGKTKPALTRYFLYAKYQGTYFRYQTFTKQDFGICYAVVDNYLVVTTSYAQMKLILNELKKPINP